LADLSDDELMLMFREGDGAAFDTLFDRYYTSVYHFARTMLDSAASAEDVLQDTFLAVARAARRYEPRGCFRVWLMRIVRNRCLNCIQSERLRRAVVSQVDFQVVDPVSHDPAPEHEIDVSEEMQLVRQAIAQLPERQREAIVLYGFERLTYREISDVLDMPINTVKTLIHRARAALAQALEEREDVV